MRIGMRPELVLDDDEKKTRFRKFLSKKQDEHEHNESRVDASDRNNSLSPSYELEHSSTPAPLHDIRDRPSFHSPMSHNEQAQRMADPSLPHGSLMYNSRMSPPKNPNSAITKAGAAKSTSYLFDPPITEVKTEVNIIQNCSSPYSQNTSMNSFVNYNYLFKKNTFHPFQGEQLPFQMYPEKPHQNPVMNTQGENFRNWARFPQYLKTNQNHPSHPDPFYGNQVTYQSQHQQSSPVKALEMLSTKKEDMHCYPYTNQNYNDKNAKSVITNNTKDESLQMTLSQSMKDLNQFSKSLSSEIPSTSSKTYQSVFKPKEEVDDYDSIQVDRFQWFKQFTGEELIQRYVKQRKSNNSLNAKDSFLEKFCSNQQDFQDSSTRLPDQGKRKSVIVRAGANKETEREIEKLNETNMSDIIDHTLSLIPDAGEMLKNFNFEIMQDLYTNEEHSHIERIVGVWQDKWDEISFGQSIVGQYINFCQHRNEFPYDFFKLINLQIRERCLNFVCSLDEIDQICVEDQIFLFRRNLDNAEMMAYVHSFNQKTWTEELEFVLGKNDKMQWMERDTNISGLPLSTMVTHMPLSEVEKLELYKNLMCCVMTVVTDRTVFILMWLIIVFSQDEGEHNGGVLRIKNSFVTMLMRYLLQKRGTNIDTDMNMVYNCIAALPRIAKSFTKIKESMKC